jgi:hypothetical protein
MVERGGDSRLPQEAGTEAIVVGRLRGEELEGDLAVEGKIVGAVDDAHPAPTQQGLNAVTEELRADPRV